MRPVLYSFRRCPYAMRARLALAASGTEVALREVVLRDKPGEMLAASPKGTVPVLVLPDGRVIEQSLDIMLWALARHDPEGWLQPQRGTLAQMLALIAQTDAAFKRDLDRYKYAPRPADAACLAARDAAAGFLQRLNVSLAEHNYLFGTAATLADMAILPFVRQFANVDRAWFDSQPWPALIEWLQVFLASTRFENIMIRYPKWHGGDPLTIFPQRGDNAS